MVLTGLLGCVLHPRAARVQADRLRDLQALFESDPAAAFETAARLFEDPKAQGDLDGMMALVRVVAPEAKRCLYAKVLDDMIDAAVPLARDAGRWETLGELCLARAETCFELATHFPLASPLSDMDRACYFGVQAADAYERAGKLTDEMAQWAEWARRYRKDAEGRPQLPLDAGEPDPYKEGILASARFQTEGRDAEAVAAVAEVLARLARDPRPGAADYALTLTGGALRLRGGERLVPLARAAWQLGCSAYGPVVAACGAAWSGRDDAFRDLFYWLWAQAELLPSRTAPYGGGWPMFVAKLGTFGRRPEAAAAAGRYLAWTSQAPSEVLARTSLPGPEIVLPYAPREHHAALLDLWCRATVAAGWYPSMYGQRSWEPWRGAIQARLGALLPVMDRLISIVPEPERPQAAQEVSQRLVETVLGLPENTGPVAGTGPPPGPLKAQSRADALVAAADHIRRWGCDDLAGRVLGLSKGLAQGDADVGLSCALLTAQAAAEDGRWQAAESQLEPALAGR